MEEKIIVLAVMYSYFKIILSCFVGLFLLGSCSSAKTEAKGEQKKVLLVSIAPYQCLVGQIAGSDFEVRSIVPSATNPHSFEPTCRQVVEMGEGVTWFRIGEPFEAKILPILQEKNPQLQVHDLREGIPLIEEGSGGLGCSHCGMDHFDRHIWLSPKLASRQAVKIAEQLSLQFPEKKESFQANLSDLEKELISLDQEIQEILQPVTSRLILVSHPAFGYFCQDYHFEQLSVEYEGKDPRPQHLQEILRRAVGESMELALALPQYNNKGAQVIAEKLHVPVHLIDPYSADYFQMLRKLAKTIAMPYSEHVDPH